MRFIRFTLAAAIMGCTLIHPALAQDTATGRGAVGIMMPRDDNSADSTDSAANKNTDNREARRLLAQQIHELRPISTQVADALNYIGADLSPDERQLFRQSVMANMDMDQLQETSINAMVQVFTAPELAAMAEYYSKPESASIEAKSSEYRQRIDPVIASEINTALSRLQAAMVEAEPNPAPLRPR